MSNQFISNKNLNSTRELVNGQLLIIELLHLFLFNYFVDLYCFEFIK